MKNAFPAMSRTPISSTPGTIDRGRRHDAPATRMNPRMMSACVARRIASGPKTRPGVTCAIRTLKVPSPRPATNAKRTPLLPDVSPPTRDTRTTAASASPIPTRTSAPGSPSSTMPAPTGMTAASTPVAGATTLIRPAASPAYSALIPITPAAPVATDQPMSTTPGERLAAHDEEDLATTMPVVSVSSTIPVPGPRRPASPPPKSPAPHGSADRRPKRTTSVPTAARTSLQAGAPSVSGGGRCGAVVERVIIVHGGQSGRLDDGVGGLVVQA